MYGGKIYIVIQNLYFGISAVLLHISYIIPLFKMLYIDHNSMLHCVIIDNEKAFDTVVHLILELDSWKNAQ